MSSKSAFTSTANVVKSLNFYEEILILLAGEQGDPSKHNSQNKAKKYTKIQDKQIEHLL